MAVSQFQTLWQEWFNLHDELSQKKIASDLGGLAGLFPGHKPQGFEDHQKRILYVGKSTAGPFNIDAFDVRQETTPFEARLTRQQAFAEGCFDGMRGGFWSFGRQLSGVLGCTDLSNLAWSNLCKIGTKLNNPSDDLCALQK